MADQRRVPAPPKIPPPPPPRSRAAEASGENFSLPLTDQGGARPIEDSSAKGSPESPSRENDIERSVPAAPEQSEVVDMLSPPAYVHPPKHYYVSKNPEGRGPRPKPPAEEPTPQKGFFRSMSSSQSEPPRPTHTSPQKSLSKTADRRSPSRSPQKSTASEETTPKKGFFQSMYSRTRGLLSRKKESSYEPLQQQQATAPNSPALTPKKKRGLLSTFFEGRGAANNPDSSPDSSREYSRLNDSSLNESFTEEDPKATAGGHDDDDGDAPECDRRADTQSEVSESDLAMAAAGAAEPQDDCDGADVTEVCHIKVKEGADIRIGTSESGDVTTCLKFWPTVRRSARKYGKE